MNVNLNLDWWQQLWMLKWFTIMSHFVCECELEEWKRSVNLNLNCESKLWMWTSNCAPLCELWTKNLKCEHELQAWTVKNEWMWFSQFANPMWTIFNHSTCLPFLPCVFLKFEIQICSSLFRSDVNCCAIFQHSTNTGQWSPRFKLGMCSDL